MGRKKLYSGDEKERERQSARKYRNSEKGKITIKHYRSSEKGRENHNKTVRKYRKTKKGRSANYQRKFGITLEDYDKMLDEQKGICAICKKPESVITKYGLVRRLAVDHNHKTGKVRALLCTKCNAYVGMFENEQHVGKVKEYLKKYSN